MSPRVFREGELIFWFHRYDALHENRASIHVGKGSQNDVTDAKIWLEPKVVFCQRSLHGLWMSSTISPRILGSANLFLLT